MVGANQLQNRRAIITGASQGFGFAVARTFVAQGAHVLICGAARLIWRKPRES